MRPIIKKGLLVFAAVTLLASCGGGDDDPDGDDSEQSGFVPGPDISIARKGARFYAGAIDSPVGEMTIYAAKGQGDVPYVNLSFATQIFSIEDMRAVEVSVKDKVYTMTSSFTPSSKAEFDAGKNEIRLYDFSQHLGSKRTNNGLGRDYALPPTQQAVRGSSKTAVVKKGASPLTLNLNDYGLKIYEQGGQFYAPLELLNLVVNSNSLYQYMYNGRDYFRSPESLATPALSTYCYSGNGGFYFGLGGGTFSYRITTAKTGEKYRYAEIDNGGGESGVFLALYPDGKGKFVKRNGGAEEELRNDYNMVKRVAFEEDKDDLTLYFKDVPATDAEAYPSKDDAEQALRVNKGETRFGKKTRSEEVAKYSYGLLCLNFDYFYGIKEFKSTGSFDAYFQAKGLKDRLKSTDCSVVSEAMYQFLHQNIDDGHSALLSLSAYEAPNNVTRNKYEIKYPGARVKRITGRSNELNSKRWTALGHNPGTRGYTDISGDTAMVSFNSFVVQDCPGYFRNYIDSEADQLINLDTGGYMAGAIMEIERYNADAENKTKVKNVVVDLTCNGGGSMATLPYIAGIMTANPCMTVKDATSGKVTTYHYECDFDGDGKYGDTYADKFNFFVLTSSASFSCGTSLPGMLKGTNVKIIGEKSAGGCAPVTHFSDGSGFLYQTSGADVVCYKSGDEFLSIEEGIPVDAEVSEDIWYDLPKLSEKLNQILAAK